MADVALNSSAIATTSFVAQKVTWPTRKETTVTTIMVFVMVVIASIFFLLADQVMRIAVSFLLGINS